MPNTPEVGFGFGLEGEQPLLSTIKQLREELKNLKQQEDSVASSARSLASAWHSIVDIAGALKLAQFAKEAFDSAVSIGRLSAATGISAQTLSVYRKATRDAGLSQEQADTSIKRLARSMLQLEQGNKQAAATFAMLRDEAGKPIAAQSFQGLTDDQKFLKVVDALGQLKGGFEASGVAAQLLGRNASEMLAVMQRLSGEGFGELYRQTKALGLLLTDDMIKALARAKASEEDLKDGATGAATQFEIGLLPAAADVGDALVKHFSGDGVNGLKTLGEWAGIVAKVIAGVFFTVGDIIGTIMSLIAETAVHTFNQVKASARTILEAGWASLKGDPAGALSALKRGWSELAGNAYEYAARIKGVWHNLNADLQRDYANLMYEPERKLPPGAGKGRPTPKAPAAGNRELLTALADKAAAERAAAQQELADYRADAKLREEQDKIAYDKGILTLQEYYARRAEEIRQGAATEQQAIERQLLAEIELRDSLRAVPQGEKDTDRAARLKQEDAAQREIAQLIDEYYRAGKTGELELAKLQAAGDQAAIEHKTRLLELQREIATAEGNAAGANAAAAEIEDLRMRNELRQLGQSEAEINAILARLAAARASRTSYGTAETGLKEEIEQLRTQQEEIKAAGLSEAQTRRQLVALARQEIPALEAKLRLLTEIAIASNNPELIASAQKQVEELAKVEAELKKQKTDWEQLSQAIQDDFKKSFEQILTSGRGMGENLIKALRQTFAKFAADKLLDKIFPHKAAPQNPQEVAAGKLQGAGQVLITASHDLEVAAAKLAAARPSVGPATARTAGSPATQTATLGAQPTLEPGEPAESVPSYPVNLPAQLPETPVGEQVTAAADNLKNLNDGLKGATDNLSGFGKVLSSIGSIFGGGGGGGLGGLTSVFGFARGGLVQRGPQALGFAAGGWVARSWAPGGLIRGPGTASSDSIPAMLSNGEFVVNARATARLGPEALEMLNRGAFLPALRQMAPYSAAGLHRYAEGGAVTPAPAAAASPSNLLVQLHPEALNMTMSDWLDREVARQFGRR